jgi:hypothetical protein
MSPVFPHPLSPVMCVCADNPSCSGKTGAIVGIAVGAVAFVSLLFCLFVCIRRRRYLAAQAGGAGHTTGRYQSPPGLGYAPGLGYGPGVVHDGAQGPASNYSQPRMGMIRV